MIHQINDELVLRIKTFKPDIVWIFKGIDILPQTLLRIKDVDVKLINYNPDHPFMRSYRSGGGKEIEDCIPLYDLHFCYSKEVIREFERRYGSRLNCAFLPFGFELSKLKAETIQLDTDLKGEINKLCFIGNPDKYLRLNVIKELINNKIPIDIYGYEWSKFIKSNNSGIRIFSGLSENAYWETIYKYRVQLNIFRPHNINSHNMRTFEIPAIGGIQLAPDTNEHREFFNEGTEILLYDSIQKLIERTDELLSMKKDEADYIRKAALDRSYEEDYSYARRAKDVLVSMEELMK